MNQDQESVTSNKIVNKYDSGSDSYVILDVRGCY